MTGPGKTGLIYTKYTCLYYSTYLLFCKCYPKSVNFIVFLMDFCICVDILDTIQITDKTLLLFKLSKSGQILCVDKTCFPRRGHILRIKSLEHLADVYKTSKIILEIIRLTTLNVYYMPYIVYYSQ